MKMPRCLRRGASFSQQQIRIYEALGSRNQNQAGKRLAPEKGTEPVISQRAIHPRGFFIEAFL